MDHRSITTKMELLAEVDEAWEALITAIERLSERQMTTVADANGWTVKDHILHLAAWERSVLFALRGLPRHEGLEVDEELYRRGDDEINAVLKSRYQDLPYDAALERLRGGHRELRSALESLTDVELNRPYRLFLPNPPDDDDERSAMDLIYANTTHHFGEHRQWMEELVGE
jgi:uncharacterized protein (TIGR03083 family)